MSKRSATLGSAPTVVLVGVMVAGHAFAQASPVASYTAAQADRGKKVYVDACSACHGDKMEGDGDRALPLAADQFNSQWLGRPVIGKWNFMVLNMPFDKPGELPKETYADIMAYILQFNGVPVGDEPFPIAPAANLLIQRRR